MGESRHRKALLVGVLPLLTLAGHAFGQSTINTLASFNGSDGQFPYAGLTLSGTTLYGTTSEGGTNGDGAVFSVPTAGGTPMLLASFTGSNGDHPEAGVTLSSDGTTLYGTTDVGGPSETETYEGNGEVFSVPVAGGTPTVLVSFDGNNAHPSAGLTLSGTTLLGTTSEGGAYGAGNVFSIPEAGNTPTVLASFNGSNGEFPESVLTLSANGTTLYGTTEKGGANGDGEVFSVPIAGGTPTVLASFNGSDGASPIVGLTLSHDGTTLYGTTSFGGAGPDGGDGDVFSVPVAGGTPTVLFSFDAENPYVNLALSADGTTLYGTTEAGGANGDGEVFSLPVAGGTPTVLASFNGSNGAYPSGGLLLSGNTLYGTTGGGGASEDGTVFSITVPEPASASLLALAGLGLLRRRRRV